MSKVIAVLAALVVATSAQAADVQVGPQGVLYVDGEPTFLVGLSPGPPPGGLTPDGSDAWTEVAGKGVRMYRYVPTGAWSPQMYPHAEAFLDHVQAHDGVVWLGLRELAQAQPGTPEDATLRDVVQRFASHPGLGIWRGVDEPWWSGVPAEETAHAYMTVNELDPETPMLTIQAPRGTAADLAPYSAFTDIHGADPYPVRFRTRKSGHDLGMVGKWTRLMSDITSSRAVVMTLGICHSGARSPDLSTFVLPTRHELRFQVYDAIMNGARGLNFYGSHLCLSPADAELGWNWTAWFTALRPVLAEIAAEAPLHDALVRPNSGRAGLRVSGPGSAVVSRRTATDLWVIVANRARGEGQRTIRVSGLPKTARRAKLYGQARYTAVRNGVATLRLREWGVQVLRVPIGS
jgi:hypothetical protein